MVKRLQAHGDMPIRRRLGIARQLAKELSLILSVTLVLSVEIWMISHSRQKMRDAGDLPTVAAAAVKSSENRPALDIGEIDDCAGHPGVRSTRFFTLLLP